jgi:hypothetical protein
LFRQKLLPLHPEIKIEINYLRNEKKKLPETDDANRFVKTDAPVAAGQRRETGLHTGGVVN